MSTISANFVYYATTEFVVRFSIPGVTDVLEYFGYPTRFPIAEFPLAEAPFAQAATIRIETVDVEGLIAARARAEAALAAEQAQSLALSAELAATAGDLNAAREGWEETNASLARTEAELAATKGTLSSARDGWEQTNGSLAQTQGEVAAANSVAAGSVGLPIILIAALSGIAAGFAAGWLVQRRRPGEPHTTPALRIGPDEGPRPISRGADIQETPGADPQKPPQDP